LEENSRFNSISGRLTCGKLYATSSDERNLLVVSYFQSLTGQHLEAQKQPHEGQRTPNPTRRQRCDHISGRGAMQLRPAAELRPSLPVIEIGSTDPAWLCRRGATSNTRNASAALQPSTASLSTRLAERSGGPRGIHLAHRSW